jgi:uridine kinase
MHNELLEKLLRSKNNRDICPDTVRRVLTECERRYKKAKDVDKAVREALHGISGAFMTPQEARQLAYDMQAWHVDRTNSGLEKMLLRHASTRERLPISDMDALYSRIFAITGRPRSVLDLACGINPLYLGTDDYFINRDDMEVDENGNRDYEGLSAVDTKLFASQMNDLLSGKKVDIPEFDFISGTKIFGKRITSIREDQAIVIEGIHALNPKLSEGIDDKDKFRIYISPLTQLNIDMHHRIPTTDARLFRRLVRDHRTRGRSAATTIHDWPAVRHGEDDNIFPYNSEADAFFNSHFIYELAVLKKYAQPLLEEITPDLPEYPEAQRYLGYLKFFVSLEDETAIPCNSIIREFIGGSVLTG